mgnify:CR=1 FL=1
MLTVGDLIYLPSEQRIGLILAIVPVEPYKLVAITYDETLPPIDLKVMWADGKIGWCLGESVIVLSSTN